MKEWKEFAVKRSNIIIFVLTAILFLSCMLLFARFLLFIESRPDEAMQDPLMMYFQAKDFNIPIFILIYGSIFLAFAYLIPHPKLLTLGLHAYIIMLIFRTIIMYLTPLDVPVGTINLRDPLIFFLGPGKPVTKDLFFSGHIATLTILYLTAGKKFLKYIFFIVAVAVGLMILLQKAHYTTDLITAPFISYAAYIIAKKISAKCFHENLQINPA